MAVLPNTDITTTAVRNELSESANAIASDLCQSSLQNKHSFYRGGRIRANATTRLVELVNVAGYKLADFRNYDHNASSPTPFNNLGTTINWGPGGGTTTIGALVNLQALNVKEIAYYDSQSYDYIQIDLYSSAANRTAGTPIVVRQKFAINWSTPTILPNHTIDDYGITQAPASPQLITLINVPTTYSHLYGDTYITNSAGTRKITLDNPYSDWDMHEFQSPIIKSTALQNVPSGNAPNGSPYIAAFIQTLATATPFPGTTGDVTQTFAATTYTVYVHIIGSAGANFYALGVTDCKIIMSGMGSDFDAYSGALSHSANTLVTGTLPASQTWQYDDVGLLDSDIVAGDYNGNTTLLS
jgi:hypothetical protein